VPSRAGRVAILKQLLERDAQFAALHAAMAAAKAGQGRLVFVSGEAGVGKTALVREFAEAQLAARVLIGASEPLDTPEALAPLFDVAPQLGSDIQARLAGEPRRAELFAAVVTCLESDAPWLLVLEDVHWADQASLDLLRYLGRRVDRLHGVVIATYRDDDATATTPLSIVLGDLAPTRGVIRLGLEPLSEAATRQLAHEAGSQADELFERTGGNPFFVTEVLAAATERVPTTVRDAVLARVARLPEATRQALEIAAALGRRFEAQLLAAVLDACTVPRWTMRDAVFRGMVRWEGPLLAFRHALAQAAISDSIRSDRLQDLHRAILAELERNPAPDRYAAMVTHAEAAGDDTSVLRYAPLAAARAAKLSAHRESARLYAKAFSRASHAPAAVRAELAEGAADQLYHSAELVPALARFQEAARLWRADNNWRGVGRALTRVAAISFLVGKYADAECAEAEAFNLLEGEPPNRELVMAYENRSRRLFMELDAAGAEQCGRIAQKIAENVGDADVELSARVCVGSARLLAADESARGELVECHRLATEADLPDLAARIALYLGWLPILFHSYTDVERFLTEGQAYAADHELEYWRLLVAGARVRYCLDQGRWLEAEALAPTVLDRPDAVSLARITVLVGIGRLHARRGQADSQRYLDEAVAMAMRHGRLEPVAGAVPASIEAMWLNGDCIGVCRTAEAAVANSVAVQNPWWLGEIQAILRRAGRRAVDVPYPIAEPYRLELAGEWRAAAEWWHSRGCIYQTGVVLGSADDATAVSQGIRLLDGLGATAAAAWARRRLRALGVTAIPRGPRPTTIANPARLTRREQDVLSLVADGLSNAEIASRLFLSRKTVERHLSGAMHKLDASSRAEAVDLARRLGALG
jgi:DNA-binding CsgD family transcriptional regulator